MTTTSISNNTDYNTIINNYRNTIRNYLLSKYSETVAQKFMDDTEQELTNTTDYTPHPTPHSTSCDTLG